MCDKYAKKKKNGRGQKPFHGTVPVFYLSIFKNVIYSCNVKAEFSTSLLQSSGSLYPSEIILIYTDLLLKKLFFPSYLNVS